MTSGAVPSDARPIEEEIHEAREALWAAQVAYLRNVRSAELRRAYETAVMRERELQGRLARARYDRPTRA